MMIHVAQNPEKTRRAVAKGKRVQFYRCKRKGGSVSEQLRVWLACYPSHEIAKAAADAWAHETKIH